MSDDADLLNILNAHGQNFLGSFSPRSLQISKKRKRAANNELSEQIKARKVDEEEVEAGSGSDDEEDEEDEWHGFGTNGGESSAETDDDGEGYNEEGDEGSEEEIEGM